MTTLQVEELIKYGFPFKLIASPGLGGGVKVCCTCSNSCFTVSIAYMGGSYPKSPWRLVIEGYDSGGFSSLEDARKALWEVVEKHRCPNTCGTPCDLLLKMYKEWRLTPREAEIVREAARRFGCFDLIRRVDCERLAEACEKVGGGWCEKYAAECS